MKTNKINIYIIFALLSIVLLCLNFFTVESVQDDYAYKFAWVNKELSQSAHRVNSIGDVISSQFYHYLYQNGRLIPHFILQVFDGVLGKWLFNFFNSVVFCLLVWMMNKLSGKEIKTSLLLVSIALIIFFAPIFKETVLWFAGSVNYLWSVASALFFIYICKYIKDKPINDKIVVWSPFAVFIAWVNEAATIPVCISLGFLMLVGLRNYIKSAILPFALFFVLGVVLTVFAPSTFNRIEELGQSDGITMIDRCLSVFAALREVRIFWFFVVLSLIVFFKKREIFYQFEREQRLLILCVFSSFIVFFISTRHYARVLFPIEIFSATGIVLLLYQLKQIKYERWLNCTVAILLIIFAIPLLYYSYQNKKNSDYALTQLKDISKTVVLTKPDQTPRFLYNHVMKHVDYGERDVWYWACEKVDMVAEFFGKRSLEYYPEPLYIDMLNHPENYKTMHTIEGCKLYAMEIPDNLNVSQVIFRLNPTNPQKVFFALRPFIEKLEKYSSLTDTPRSFRTKKIGNHNFLIFTPPLIPEKRMRLKSVEYM